MWTHKKEAQTLLQQGHPVDVWVAWSRQHHLTRANWREDWNWLLLHMTVDVPLLLWSAYPVTSWKYIDQVKIDCIDLTILSSGQVTQIIHPIHQFPIHLLTYSPSFSIHTDKSLAILILGNLHHLWICIPQQGHLILSALSCTSCIWRSRLLLKAVSCKTDKVWHS